LEEPPVDRVPRGRGIFRRFRSSGNTRDTDDASSDQPQMPANERPSEPEEQDGIVVLQEERRDRPDDVSNELEDETAPDAPPSMDRGEIEPPPVKLSAPPTPPGASAPTATGGSSRSEPAEPRRPPTKAAALSAKPEDASDGDAVPATGSTRSPGGTNRKSGGAAPTAAKKARSARKAANRPRAKPGEGAPDSTAGAGAGEPSVRRGSSTAAQTVGTRHEDAEDTSTTPSTTGDGRQQVGEDAVEVPAEEVDEVRTHQLPRVLAIANQKGGVGKTTTAVNLGAALAELGYRVLVIDLDPQGNATTGLGINSRNLELSVYDVIMHETSLEDCIEPTNLRNLFLVPATINLAGAEIELVPAFSRELRLRRAIEGADQDFDFTMIDCPPSLGLLTVNGLAAAGEVLVPIQCEYYALEGLGQLLRNVELVRVNLNPTLDLSTIILTMFDARTKLSDEVAEEIRKHFGDKVCRSIVPRTVRLSEAPSFGLPIILFDSSSRGALAYRELAKEVSGGASQRIG
jgi:chromosome partitioning protein